MAKHVRFAAATSCASFATRPGRVASRNRSSKPDFVEPHIAGLAARLEFGDVAL